MKGSGAIVCQTMNIDPTQAAIAIGVPAAAMLIGAASGLAWRPGPKVRSAVQHLAAGIIFAAVATELVPTLVAGTSWVAMSIGFFAGVVLMLGIRVVFDGDDGGEEGALPDVSVGMFAGLSVDLLIDGLLVALALSADEQGGMVLAAGVSFETFFLGMALAAVLAGRSGRLMGLAGVLALCLLIGGGGGLALATSLSGPWRLGLLAFGAAALLYLVTEELLVEAHQGDGETVGGTMLFFIGFGATLAITSAST